MLKEQMYKELRDELELYERARQDETKNSRIKKPEEILKMMELYFKPAKS